MILKKIKGFYKNNLKYKTNVSISKWSILLIIIMNIMVLTFIYSGLDFQTNITNHPSSKIDGKCFNVHKYPEKVINYKHYMYNETRVNKYTNIKNNEKIKECKEFENQIFKVKESNNIPAIKAKIKNIDKNLNKLYNEKNKVEQNYNTSLFEVMANAKDNSILDKNIQNQNIQKTYNVIKIKIKNLEKEKIKIIETFSNNKETKKLEMIVLQNKRQVLDKYYNSDKYYYIKQRIIEITFTLPLVIIFYYLTKRYLRKEEYIKYIINKNLLVVSMIPLVIAIVSLINQFIPKVFIAKIIDFLYKIEIPFVAYYLAILIVVIVLGFVIVKVQNRVNNQSRNNKISFSLNYNLGKCNSCLHRVNYDTMNYCPHCKNKLKEKCKKCDKYKVVGLNHCHNCGE